MTNMNIREELLCRPTNGRKIREVELQENGLLACLTLQLGDCLICLLSVARRQVNLCVVRQELLSPRLTARHNTLPNVGKRENVLFNAPLRFPFRHQYCHLRNHVEKTGTRAFI